MINLDFSLLSIIKRVPIFRGNVDFGGKLESLELSETLNRLRGASVLMGNASEIRTDLWLTHTYFRAGLSEFRSVEQAIRWDKPNDNDWYKPNKSKNPLIHLMYRLRRISVYLENADLEKKNVTVVARLSGKDINMNTQVYLINNIEKYLRKEKKLGAYKSEDITAICKWFEENQSKFGAAEIFNFGIIIYCRELFDYYSC